jgi:hypothetical protein
MGDTGNTPTYRDPDLFLDGVDPQKRAEAEREIWQFIRAMTKGAPHPVVAFIVTDNFVPVIESLKRFGIKQLQDSPYQQFRRHVVAVAKTMPCYIDGSLGFVIVISSNALDEKVFKKWVPDYVVARQYYIAHEFVHVADMHAEAVAIGAGRFMDPARWTEDRKLLNAGAFWLEYHAMRFVTESLGTHEIEKALGYEDALAKLLTELPEFLKTHIASFRLWQFTVEQYLEKVGPWLSQMLVLWAYLLAMEDAGVSFSKAYATTRTYEVVLKPREDAVKVVVRRMFADQWKYQSDELGEIGDRLDEVLEKGSLRFRPAPMGSLRVEVLDVQL